MTDIAKLLAEANARVASMSPEEREAVWEAQRQSWIRAMATPCEHGELDWEDCQLCRKQWEQAHDGA